MSTSKQTQIRLEYSLLERMDRLSEKTGLSRSDIMRWGIHKVCEVLEREVASRPKEAGIVEDVNSE